MLQFEANFRLNSHSPSQEEPLNASALLNIVGLIFTVILCGTKSLQRLFSRHSFAALRGVRGRARTR